MFVVCFAANFTNVADAMFGNSVKYQAKLLRSITDDTPLWNGADGLLQYDNQVGSWLKDVRDHLQVANAKTRAEEAITLAREASQKANFAESWGGFDKFANLESERKSWGLPPVGPGLPSVDPKTKKMYTVEFWKTVADRRWKDAANAVQETLDAQRGWHSDPARTSPPTSTADQNYSPKHPRPNSKISAETAARTLENVAKMGMRLDDIRRREAAAELVRKHPRLPPGSVSGFELSTSSTARDPWVMRTEAQVNRDFL